jgi:hypothetical protein
MMEQRDRHQNSGQVDGTSHQEQTNTKISGGDILSRRQFLSLFFPGFIYGSEAIEQRTLKPEIDETTKVGLALRAALALTICGISVFKGERESEELPPPILKPELKQDSLLESVTPPEGGIPIKLRGEEYKIPTSPKDFPDTRTSWFRKDGKLFVFASAGTDSVRFVGSDWGNLAKPQTVLKPDKDITEFGFNGYRGFSTVLPRADGKLVGVLHKELWPSKDKPFPFTAEIEVTISDDDGLTWCKPETVLRGKDVYPDHPDVQGVGQPGCIPAKGKDGRYYLYTYYTDWHGAHDICLAKVPLNEASNPDSWKIWNGQAFSEPGIGGNSQPVISANNSYVALSQPTWNPDLGRYLMLNEQNTGFFIRSSKDGVNWTDGQMIAKVQSPLSKRKTEDTWYSYPTLIKPDAPNQFISGIGEHLLLASRGIWNINAHRGVLLPIDIG